MDYRMGMEKTFNEDPAGYDKWRPTYVPELYADILAYHEIGPASSVLEVGIGTGQATRPILDWGCKVTAAELGDRLAAFTREKYRDYPNLQVVNIAFQDFDAPDESYDMVYSASAFHWIPEEIGYPKVLRLLKPGGIFARFANNPYQDKEREAMESEIQKVYAKYMPGSKPSPEFDEEQCRQRANIAGKYGFTDIEYHLYHRTRTFTAKEYVALIHTYSDHHSLEEGFFDGIENAIERGGGITLYDTINLQLARKP